MGFRVTQSILNQNMLNNLQTNNRAMEKYQNQITSGKKVTKPSDNPVTVVRGMAYRSSLNDVDQYKRNANDGFAWMTTTEEALNEVTSVMQRVRELTVQGLNGTNDESARNAIADEIKQLREHLGDVANSQIAGKYIFAGTDFKNPPFVTGIPKEFSNQNVESITAQVGQTNNVQTNVLGTDVFDKAINGDGGIFQVLSDIYDYFQSGTGTNDLLVKLDGQIDNLLKERSELGARMNRMELSISRLDGLEISTTNLVSNEEDVDISRAIIDLKSQENVQRAALSVGARIIQTSLVDFLR
ncbi:flagellar hook-associated protein FlgL [Neobacillus drentensis]|uniref:flagellar hook-associated protein FlgL n=1 Tax=Neobacillus drentensis TaxID=220684 RepID=UPI00286376FF|nr:flagellar hook-associated protein FlgL [Neobacillus drentensis]MDR7235707.1 flagellar hook-associated protein 3 FlgL [Neobacillus drentensis]